MNKLTCVITDDEPLARQGLRGYISKIEILTLSGECEDALQLNVLLQTNTPDLLFLDIEMPCLSGMDFLVGLANPPRVIIVSAYEQYALKGYELDVDDYLLKPVSFARFLKAVNKVYSAVAKERLRDNTGHIFVKADGKLKKVELADILFIRSMENYVVIHTVAGREVVNTTLKQMMERLGGGRFMQVHRSYIVNTARVDAIEGNRLLVGTQKIPVVRALRDDVLDAIINSPTTPRR